MYFYRDSAKNEVDILLEAGDGIRLLEVKSAQTVASDAMKPTRVVADILGDRVKNMILIYGGEDYQKRSDFEVLPYKNLKQWLYS